jgi:VanZ family protein
MNLRKVLSWFWTLVIFLLCWLPRQYVPSEDSLPAPFVLNIDKWIHAGIFAVFAILWMLTGNSKWRALWIFFSGIAIAAITELGQRNRIVNRDGNLADATADTVGVILGLLAFWIAQRVFSKNSSVSRSSVS